MNEGKRQIVRVAFVLLAGSLLAAGCESEPTNTPTIPAPPTSRQAPAQPSPVTPIRLQKPRTLGPVGPAIVSLPSTMREPVIRVRLGGERDQPLTITTGQYRGTVETYRLANGNYITINKLPIETYLVGVLAKELYPSWSPETYRAQAIAARTYALYQILTEESDSLWDVSADEGSQMYGGRKAETPKAREAVTATRGQVLMTTWQNQMGIFCSFFSSCSGGASQDPFDARGDMPVGPLSARNLTPWEITANCPKFYWGPLTIRKADVTRAVQAWGMRNELPYLTALGPIQKVTITRRNPTTGRPVELALIDIAGRSAPIRAEEFRLALLQDPAGIIPAPQSSQCDIVDAGESIRLINGRGYGHGIGLSQWGAQGMAVAGRNAYQILSYYYPGASLHTAW